MVMEFIGQAAEFILSFVIVLLITGITVVALGSWMQNNPTMQARRNSQATAALRKKIAQETANQRSV